MGVLKQRALQNIQNPRWLVMKFSAIMDSFMARMKSKLEYFKMFIFQIYIPVNYLKLIRLNTSDKKKLRNSEESFNFSIHVKVSTLLLMNTGTL